MEFIADDFQDFLLKHEAYVKSLIESFYDGVLITDSKGIVLFVNKNYLSLTGLTASEIVGKPLEQVRTGSLLPQALKDGKMRIGTYRREGDTEYIVDVGPIFYQGAIIGGIGVTKTFEQVKKLSRELEKHITKTRELKSAVNRAYQAEYTFQDIVGDSLAIQKAIAFAKKIAKYDADILITGESGTGKEVFSQAIHNASLRSDMPFIPINCPTLNPSLIESELFGYSSGTFTGALKGGKAGLFSIADGGTVMLDEIGDLPYEMQAKLLRVLQERRIRRVGESSEEAVNIRVIAATNKNLLQLVKEGKFREDLYYRLSSVTLELPNLRNRKHDLRLLANSFLTRWCRRQGIYLTFDPVLYEVMELYDWPGNIRELRNVIELAAYTCEGKVITDLPLPASVVGKTRGIEYGHYATSQRSLKEILGETERMVIKSMISQYGDTVEAKKKIADTLKISLATFYNKAKFLSEEE